MKTENTGHGHVYPRPDGVKARCGGPGICSVCSLEANRKEAESLDDCAVNVIGEAADIYWEKLRDCPAAIKRLSMHDLRQIFDLAVVPAIDRVRELDREFRS